MRKRRRMMGRRRIMMKRRRRWRGREGMRRIYRTACWWRRELLSFPCISCYKVLSANKKLNNHIVEMHKDPSSCILCNTSFEIRTFLLRTSLCTSHHHTPGILGKCIWRGESLLWETERNRVHLCNVCDKDKKFHTHISIHRHNKFVLVGLGPPRRLSLIWTWCGGGKKEDGSCQLQEEGSYLLPTSLETSRLRRLQGRPFLIQLHQ